MAARICFSWEHSNPGVTGEGVVTISDEQLVDGTSRWFEDYFDYPCLFAEIYRKAKSVSSTWAQQPPFDNVRILDAPILEALEHHIHSFWIQVLRDRTLIENLLQQEKPDQIYCGGLSPNSDNISRCQFDTGLFEFSLRDIAQRIKIPVTPALPSKHRGEHLKQPWLRNMAGAVSAQAQAAIRRKRWPEKDLLLLSRHVKGRLGKAFIDATKSAGLEPVTLEPGPSPDCLTVWDLAGWSVGPGQRHAAYLATIQRLKTIPARAWREEFTIDGCDYGNIIRDVVFAIEQRELWSQINALLLCRELFQHVKPRALLVLYDHGIYEAPIVSLARQYGVKSVTMQHGLICPDIPGYLPVQSDVFACWGQAEKDCLVGQGGVPGKLAVTGFPAFDQSWSRRRERPLQKPYRVLVATQGVQSSVEWYFALTPTTRIIRELSQRYGADQRFIFTVRLHPNEQLQQPLADLAARCGIRITQGVSLARQFEEHDVVITQFSTVGVEALLAGLPLVSLNWAGEREAIPYAEHGAAVRSRNPGDLGNAIIDAVAHQEQRMGLIQSFLQQHLAGPGATQKILALCGTE